METYMNIMVSLGHAEWTSTIDESVWPKWICATKVMQSLRLCTLETEAECLGACDEWALGIEQAKDSSDELSKWKQLAGHKVVSRWVAITKACARNTELCLDETHEDNEH